ncbi:class I SAM-dependent methyltransferase [Trujillonella endophytica]|uniref:Methyltransferase domain-containing protein n=1 Tax=Trujillonella endophytica TaxID=673521 RepID=A0A1H8PZX3_9ACTN|nr:class I SAM-dependent methyltransferase [Trujillella endophytica]SEO47298.1 Methyltransferase domain-containing protein [Trujillella endophytica]
MTTEATWLESMPAVYDRHLGAALFEPFARELAGRAAALRPARVLEVAAGTGIGTRRLRAALPDAAILATDLNPAMVAAGAERVPDVEWRAADALDLGVPDGSVDLVACSFGVMFVPDKPGAFAEVARVLAPGGTLLFTAWDDVARSTFPAALVTALAEVLPEQTPQFIERVPHGYADPATIAVDVAAGSLAVQDLTTLTLTGEAPSARSLAEGFCLGTPLRFALELHGPLGELTDAIADRMTALLGEGPVRGDLTAHVVTASRPA